MGMNNDLKSEKSAQLAWLDGDMPYSVDFGDHFYCRADGRAECGHVFLAGNGLPDRWRSGGHFTIAELGFGTGLNFCETWRQWKMHAQPGGHLHFISFERFPMHRLDIGRALQKWPQLLPERMALCSAWPLQPDGMIDLAMDETTQLKVICGNATETLAASPLWADAWYLDGFAPSRNPDMWSPALMNAVYAHTVPDGTFATYAAAGHVRRNLVAAGFAVEKRRGFAEKREMLCGIRKAVPTAAEN